MTFERMIGLRAELVRTLVELLEQSHQRDSTNDRGLESAAMAVEDAAYDVYEEALRLRRAHRAAVVSEGAPPLEELRAERDPILEANLDALAELERDPAP